MELSITYECPQCRQSLFQPLRDLSPGQIRNCSECGTPLGLTPQGLAHLRQDLIHLIGR